MSIPEIRINNLRIGDVRIPETPRWLTTDPPVALPIYPPVTTQLGTPIVNIPGCVTAHKDSSENTNLKEEDDMKLRKLIDQNDIVQEIKKIFPGSKIAKSSFH